MLSLKFRFYSTFIYFSWLISLILFLCRFCGESERFTRTLLPSLHEISREVTSAQEWASLQDGLGSVSCPGNRQSCCRAPAACIAAQQSCGLLPISLPAILTGRTQTASIVHLLSGQPPAARQPRTAIRMPRPVQVALTSPVQRSPST